MPRKPIIRSNEHYYHITARSNNKENFYIPLEVTWQIFLDRLKRVQKEHDLVISTFVLMNNHFHLMMLTPDEDIDRVMYFFMKGLTSDIQRSAGRINRIFGGRYKGSLIRSQEYLMNAHKYICRNPVAAGLVDRAEKYPYSSLFLKNHPTMLTSAGVKLVEIDNTLGVINGERELEWINQSFGNEEAESIRCGLKKSVFEYGKDKLTNRLTMPSTANLNLIM